MSGLRINQRRDTVVSLPSGISVPESEKETNAKKDLLKGYTFALLIIITYTVAVVSAQLAVDSTPPFQLSFMRYTTQAVITLATVAIVKAKLKVAANKIWMVAVISIFDFIYNFSFYNAASYLAVGNMEGIFTSLIIVVLGIYDLVRVRCSVVSVISAVICCSGLLLLMQPWKIKDEVKSAYNRTIPCELFGVADETYVSNITSNRNSHESTSQSYSEMGTFRNTSSSNYYTDQFGTTDVYLHSTEHIGLNSTHFEPPSVMDLINPINDIWIGYVLIITASVSMAVISIFVEKLTEDHHPAVISFWLALTNTVISLVLMLALEQPSLPAGLYCILFTFLLTTLAALNAFFSHITLSYLLPSQTALVLSLSMVVLFIVQNTLLSDVRPGRRNAEEIVGAVVTFVGAVLSPIYLLASRLCKKEMKYNVGEESG